ncbi:TIGR03915 family putative DNA repair protein [Pseudoflavonifractor sp. MSJ-37]|nr:TIGR03915 family putative DNA repair protein [Pseudoflavonifractor sp. MSJ-37]
MPWTQVSYTYDGSFSGFLTCVYESWLHREAPAAFSTPEDPRVSLWPERPVATDEAHARRVYRSLARKISPAARELVALGFLTSAEDRELLLWGFIWYGYARGRAVTRDLTDPRVAALDKAVRHLRNEAHLYKGFLRFSERDGMLAAEIEPKDRVLPLLRPHFCARYPEEDFAIWDKTHQEVLLHRSGDWRILPAEEVRLGTAGEAEEGFRALWRRFYQTIAIPGRENEACRRSHMPKRYRNTMTEFQSAPAAVPAMGPKG